MTEVQKQFDWMKESSKCVEGLKLPVGEDRVFELVFEEVALKALERKDGTFVTKKDGSISKVWEVPFKDIETNVKFKNFDKPFWYNENERVNPANPEMESDFVKLSRKIGYQPVLDGDFAPRDFLRPGLRITAQLKELPPNKDGKVYLAIDIDTIRTEDGGDSGVQKEIEDAIDPAQQKEILAFAKGAKKFADVVKAINAKKKHELLPVAMRMNEEGQFKFPMA
jgi:hypothetical protein